MNPYTDFTHAELHALSKGHSPNYLDDHYGGMISRAGLMYDWCWPCQQRTREQYPYSYDAHYKWRDFDKDNPPEGMDCIYSDRMMQWDYEKYEAARQKVDAGWIENISREKAEGIIDAYYDGKYKCVGFAACCNVSNGYGIGIFFIVPKEDPDA